IVNRSVPYSTLFPYTTLFRSDVALIFLGDGDFGPVAQKLIRFRELEPGMAVVKYGRGISAYASAGTPPTPAFRDGLYRSATFTVDRKSTRLNSSHVKISYAVF